MKKISKIVLRLIAMFLVMAVVSSGSITTCAASKGSFPYNLAQGSFTITNDPDDANVHYKLYSTGLQVTCYDYGVLTSINASTGQAVFDSFTLQDFQMMPAQQVQMVSYPVDYSLCRTQYIPYANEVMAKIPVNVLQMLSARGVSIHVLSEDQKATVKGFDYGNVAGFYNTVTTTRTTRKGSQTTRSVETVRTIYVLDDAWTAIAHEVGHAIDDDLGDLSSTEGFKTVYQTYGGLFGSYAATSQKEFFAELYLQYLCNASQLNKYYPQLYQYMEAVTAMVS